jgi:hypothetical protein
MPITKPNLNCKYPRISWLITTAATSYWKLSGCGDLPA